MTFMNVSIRYLILDCLIILKQLLEGNSKEMYDY